MTSHYRNAASPSWPRASPRPPSKWSWTTSRPATRPSGTRRRSMSKKTLTIALMDPPYESENLTTAFRILDVAARRGYHINVFAYGGRRPSVRAPDAASEPGPRQGPGRREPSHHKGPGRGPARRGGAKRRQGGLGKLWHVRRRARRQRVRAGHAARLAG